MSPPPAHVSPGGADPLKPFAIGLLGCAAAITVAVFSKSWGSGGEGRGAGGIGPLGGQWCEGGRCESFGWDFIKERLDVPSDVEMLGYLSLLGGLAAAALLVACGVQILNRKADKAPIGLTRPALGVAAGGMVLFVMRLVTAGSKDVDFGLGWSAIVGIGAVVAASIIVQSKLLSLAAARPVAHGGAPPQGYPRAGAPYVPPPMQQPLAPPMPPPLAPPMPPPQAPAPQAPAAHAQPQYPCPRCQRPLVFVAQYQRWFCEACRDYA